MTNKKKRKILLNTILRQITTLILNRFSKKRRNKIKKIKKIFKIRIMIIVVLIKPFHILLKKKKL